MSTHIGADVSEVSKIVLMPGDPLRAKKIAETYLKDARLVNNVRGMLGYTGYYQNIRVSVMASGMGMGSMGIYSYELFKEYDVDYIIRIGSTGSYVKELELYDVLLVNEAYTESNFGRVQNGSSAQVLPSSSFLNQIIIESANRVHVPLKMGRIETTDVFYKQVNDYQSKANMGIAAVEMESYALFHNANLFTKKASCLLTVSDSFVTGEETTSEEREKNFMKMVEVALEAAFQIGETYGTERK